jgi:hypothetical protein
MTRTSAAGGWREEWTDIRDPDDLLAYDDGAGPEGVKDEYQDPDRNLRRTFMSTKRIKRTPTGLLTRTTVRRRRA